GEGAGAVIAVFALSVIAAIAFRLWAKRRQIRTGRQFPLFWSSLALVVGPPLVALVAMGFPIGFERPELRGFNFVGGVRLLPEFVALLLALTAYTAAFIAEVVRAGVLAVPRGQTEAALALGLRRGVERRPIGLARTLRGVVSPAPPQLLQPHEELLARGRRRLSRPVRGLRRHHAAPDRPSDRDHRHHHGGLSCHLAFHQRADELVQRPYPGSGTLMAVATQPSYIRRAVLE